MTGRIVTLMFSCAAALFAQDPSRSTPTRTQWKPLEFLIGTWDATTRGGSAGATSSGTYSFQLELRGHVLVRHSGTAGCQGPANFNCAHSDLLYVYPETPGRMFKAIYFDDEGHVIHYGVSTPAPATAIFLSDPSQHPSQTGPQFKLSYELKGSIMYGKFQMRMPGQAEFKSYLEWDGKSKK